MGKSKKTYVRLGSDDNSRRIDATKGVTYDEAMNLRGYLASELEMKEMLEAVHTWRLSLGYVLRRDEIDGSSKFFWCRGSEEGGRAKLLNMANGNVTMANVTERHSALVFSEYSPDSWEKDSTADTNMVSRKDEIRTSATKLIRIFGEPYDGAIDKASIKFVFARDDGAVATLSLWKATRETNETGRGGTIEDAKESSAPKIWVISAHSEEIARNFKKWLEQKL